jgi:hypothetical protein
VHEIKHDGYRLQVRRVDDQVRLFTPLPHERLRQHTVRHSMKVADHELNGRDAPSSGDLGAVREHNSRS